MSSENDSVILRLSDVSKRYDITSALSGVSFDVRRGSFVSLLGPSGCGKSTLLGLIAGTIAPDSGYIELNGVSMENTAGWQRDLSMVFQDYALFPNMTVFDNIAFGLKMRRRGMDRHLLRERVKELLQLVHLPGLGERQPWELSGGQQQRVAIARALAPQPSLLLMDEPLSNLDARVRESLRQELKEIQRSTGITTVYVTHDQEEALFLSDEIVVMRDGQIEQRGTPPQIYRRPATRFCADFVGRANLLEGRFEQDAAGITFISRTGLRLGSQMPSGPLEHCRSVMIRPEHIVLAARTVPVEAALTATVIGRQYTGAQTLLLCRAGDESLLILQKNSVDAVSIESGDTVNLLIPAAAVLPMV